ncbi:ATP-binding protein [Robbsia sp. Bb-Pol-6]|uniref:histidine kinase n=1 Tax=Robbsia betulipollinis TaxID=2981849 RepID=A0ABT3ZHP5_9BURK|nr:ATP-binding protein [Robbsia betulipollinis]MCY0386053.1 ATP-binding protein [Robbsia betulipollinis]
MDSHASDLREHRAPSVSPTAAGGGRRIGAALLKRRYRRPRAKVRFSITMKMFLAVLVACLVISLTMGYAIRVSFENGFLRYVRARDAGRVQAVSARAQLAYAAHGGNWDFLRGHPDAWIALLDAAQDDLRRQDAAEAEVSKHASWRDFPGSGTVHHLLDGLAGEPQHGPHWSMRMPRPNANATGLPSDLVVEPPRDPAAAVAQLATTASSAASQPLTAPLWDGGLPPFAPPGNAGTPPGTSMGPMGPPRHEGLRPPATLLDSDKVLVASNVDGSLMNGGLEPIVYQGRTIGWLSAGGPNMLSDAADIAFQEQQMRAALQIAGVSVVLAALVALLLARVILAPVKRLMAATHRLASGDFTARVPAGRRDELDRLAGDFNVLADSLQTTQRSRRDFIADISHELRTPLAVLRSELEAIEDGVHAFDRESLTSLQTEVTLLNTIIEDLYELSLSDVGALRYHKEPVDIGALTAAAVDGFREPYKAKQLTLRLTLPEPDGPSSAARPFEVDPGRFMQLLKNLLQNSLRYTDAGGEVHVLISVADDGWRLDVHDSEPGVPAAALPRLFDRLYRVDASRSRQSGGAGLGLALCRAIVAAHGGAIDASPSPLGGVRIVAHFPVESAEPH